MSSSLPRLDAPDGLMPVDTTTDAEGRPHVIGYVFLRDRIGWAILAVLIAQAVLLGWTVYAVFRLGDLTLHKES